MTAATPRGDVGGHAVQVCLLGGFQLNVDGSPWVVQPAGQRLLALVALAPRGVERMSAAFQLWPDTNERRAMANLRSTLWRVNRLRNDIVETAGSRLLIAEHVWIDVRDGIEEQAQHARTSSLAALPYHTVADLLPEWYDDWLVVEQERYRQWRLHQLEDRAQHALDDGHAGEALQLALSAAAIDPARTRAHALIMAAHRQEDNELDARRERQRYESSVGSLIEQAPAVTLPRSR